jgi:branched-subunit amino acid transport protein
MVWVGMALLGAASYVMRVLPLLLGGGRPPGPRAVAALRDAGMGGLAAVAVLSVLGLHGSAPTATVVAVGASALLGGVVSLRRGSMALGVVVGGAGLLLAWGLTAVVAG